ncbi:hypothetical protein [Mangrovimonas aestuarii]|uniref:hypothetical protein n=1 Tax=Mangrovimonas aestuarii TaxID=3018443 RepID=UPI0023790DC5|nr:hypothetical protein [Mangrovimonas aestuarii]
MKTIITFAALLLNTSIFFAQWPTNNDNLVIDEPSMEEILIKEIAEEETREFYNQLVLITPDIQYELLEANDGLNEDKSFSAENFYAHMGEMHTEIPNDIRLEQNEFVAIEVSEEISEEFEYLKPEMIEVFDPEEEVILGFDTKKYLPKNFNPQMGLVPKPVTSLALSIR